MKRNWKANAPLRDAACSPLDSERVDFRGDEGNAPIIHPGKNGNPVRLIVGRDDEILRHGVDAMLDLMGDSEPPP
jgi:hypothetical protein